MRQNQGASFQSMADLHRTRRGGTQAAAFLIAGALLVVAYPPGVRAAGTDQPACAGNCDGQDGVTTSDLVTMLGVTLETTDVSTCPAGDVAIPSGVITVDEIVTGIGFALTSCPGEPSSTPTGTQTAEPTTSAGIATATPTQTSTVESPIPTASPTVTETASPSLTVTPNATPTPSPSQTATATPAGTAGGLMVCSTPSLAIPDDDPSGVFDEISITEDVPITKVRVQVRITHGWVGDLEVDLFHSYDDVLVSAVLLFPPGDCGGSNVDCTLDDAADAYADDQCTDGTPAISGTLRPTEPLDAFAGGQSSSGTWQLYVYDLQPEDVGTLDSWCIEIE